MPLCNKRWGATAPGLDEVEAVLGHARGLGLKTKLDTNGSYPGKLMRLIPLLDYVAVDVEGSPSIYRRLAGAGPDGVMESLRILRDSGVMVEYRTTFVPGAPLNRMTSMILQGP